MAASDEKKTQRAGTAPKPTGEIKRPAGGPSERADTQEAPAQGLDFSKLDLSVERVDERISPSETNVFDK